MAALDPTRGVGAATASARAAGLEVDEVVVLQSSNALTLRLLPCDVVARVSSRGRGVAAMEVAIARGLEQAGSPAVSLDPRVEAVPHEHGGLVTTFWTHLSHSDRGPVAPGEVAEALAALHRGMRALDVAVPHVADRVQEAQDVVADPLRSPALVEGDRALLAGILAERRRVVVGRGLPEQVIHGEPHPGNVLRTEAGLRFIDLETCCRGPVAFDLAHQPDAVAALYPGVDRGLLEDCRLLVVAMVAAWRWHAADALPNGSRAGRALVAALRDGGPLPDLDEIMRRAGAAS